MAAMLFHPLVDETNFHETDWQNANGDTDRTQYGKIANETECECDTRMQCGKVRMQQTKAMQFYWNAMKECMEASSREEVGGEFLLRNSKLMKATLKQNDTEHLMTKYPLQTKQNKYCYR